MNAQTPAEAHLTDHNADHTAGDSAHLGALVEVWWEAIGSFTDLLEQVPADAWHTPTDLPGWDVHAIAAHTAHLEALLAGRPHDDVEVGDAPHVRGMLGRFTEQGVVARREASPQALIAEIRDSTAIRHDALRADPPADAAAPAPGPFGAIGWSTGLLLRNRPLDVWMHEQDVRRALGMPGNLDSAPARHAADYLMESLGFVVAKRAGAPAGSVVRLEVEGHPPVSVTVGEDGRGRAATPADGEPTLTLGMDRESFLVLAGGRRAADGERVRMGGDVELGERVLAGMGVTP